MMGNATLRSAALLLAAALSLAAIEARAQDYPSQDLRFLCAFPAGSGADVIVRYFAEKMRPLVKRTIIVDNKPGAGGNIAAETMVRSKPDGHTIFIHAGNTVAGNMHLIKKPPFDAAKSIQVVATINKQAFMLAVDAKRPWQTVPELTAYLKEKGDKASYAFANPTAKVLGAMYKEKAGLKSVEVAYRTGADFLNELYTGKIDYAIPDNIQAVAQANAGRMRILAVGAGKRMQAAPDIPTLTEFGYPMDIRSWWAALVPSATPRPIVDQLNAWFSQVVQTPETKTFLNGIASDPWVTKPEEGQAYFLQQINDWGDYVRLANIEPQG